MMSQRFGRGGSIGRALGLGTLALVCALGATRASAQAGFMTSHEVESLGDGLYAFRYGPYRNIFIVGDDGVIATDPINAQAAEALRDEIRKLTDQPVKYVAYSHSHWDHAVGGTIFKADGAKFVAQERCRKNIRETPHADLVEPDIVFSDRKTLSVGNRSLELYYFGPSHSDCLSVMIARPANIMFVVDLANPPSGWHIEWNPTAPDTYFWNLVPSLERIEALAREQGVEQFVGGHVSIVKGPDGKPGLAPAAGPVAAIAERRDFWVALIGAVRAEMDKGTFAEMVASRLDTSEFEERIPDYDKQEMAILIRRIGSYVFTGW